MPPSAAAALIQSRTGAASLTSSDLWLASLGLVVETALVFTVAVFWARRTVRGN